MRQAKIKSPYKTTKQEYFDWLEETFEKGIFSAREEELDAVMRGLEALQEMSPDKEFTQGVGAAMRVVFDQQVRLTVEKMK